MKGRSSAISYLLLCAIACMMIEGEVQARKIRTKLPVKKEANISEPSASKFALEGFTINELDSAGEFYRISRKVRFYGFDKTINSSMESFFISNTTDSLLAAISVEITYYDMTGRQLHSRTADIDCNIPGQETRRKDIKSWDTQKGFYYHKSAKPRRQATPFKVHLQLKSATFIPSPAAEKLVID